MKSAKKESIIIFCDGACSGNQFSKNKGGWGVVLKFGEHMKELYGGEKNTTNQRMELTACIKALEAIKQNEIPIEIYTDSAYLVNCMNQRWYEKWQRNGWKNAHKKPVENKELWEKLLLLLNDFEVSFHKVEGHAGVELNERADELARLGIEEFK
ncbi:MAG: ribonuclease HI [Ignavibacteriae bacterium]|nr:ribonuclease HI [Ignavibacteriota bacterium]